jgi:acetyl esterase/lipase
MKTTLRVERKDQLIALASEVVYMQKPYWCDCNAQQLKLSFMKPRHYYSYDDKKIYPLLIFLCGGGFQKMDRSVFLPELVYFAKKGYAVASVDYSTMPTTDYPERLIEVKTAIRFLRSHASEFCIDSDKIAIMGESAGAYLAGLAGLTGDDKQYKTGEYENVSDAVQAVVTWYAPVSFGNMDNSGLRIRTDQFPDLCGKVKEDTPPFLMMHGLEDGQVPYDQSERLYDTLQNHGVESDLYLLEGANHGDGLFIQEPVKHIISSFLDRYLK